MKTGDDKQWLIHITIDLACIQKSSISTLPTEFVPKTRCIREQNMIRYNMVLHIYKKKKNQTEKVAWVHNEKYKAS